MDEICRAVVDTSVLVAAVLGPTGASREVLRRGLDLEFIWLVSDTILKEYRKVLRSDKISERVKIPAKVLKSLDLLLEGLKRGVTMKLRAVWDQTDDIFVECAVEHHGSWVIQKAIDLSFNQLRRLRSHVPEKAKKDFWKAVAGFDRQMEREFPEGIDRFAVQVVRDYRKKIRRRS